MSNVLKVGDRVRVIAAGDCLEGREGVITEPDGSKNWPWNVMFDGGYTNVYDTVGLYLITNGDYAVFDVESNAWSAVNFRTVHDAVTDARGAAKECLGTFQVWKLVKTLTGVQEAVTVVEKDHN